ncbi:cytochrome c-type biogenesis protein [Alteromonas flava]|uniref:cytochrome c-type biogenesis protein n=1 Tax=Alteromonas flava TaxID=2048003 RepID=UPI000C28A3D7|nr:cytochrome c-type biogenesis protein [Alteromonas flava]
MRLSVLIIFTSALLFSLSSKAEEQEFLAQDGVDSYQFASPKQRETFLELTAVLRCPMCQNQNIADSDAMIAHDMRRKVYQLLKQGKTKQEVIDFMKSRYGDFVYYQPPVTPYTLWLWVLPVVFAVVALALIARKRSVNNDQDDVAQKLKHAEALLEREE